LRKNHSMSLESTYHRVELQERFHPMERRRGNFARAGETLRQKDCNSVPSWKDLGLKPDTDGDKSRSCRGIISQVKRQGEDGRGSGLLPFFFTREGLAQDWMMNSGLRELVEQEMKGLNPCRKILRRPSSMPGIRNMAVRWWNSVDGRCRLSIRKGSLRNI